MDPFLYLRNRAVQFSILAIIFLLLYAYQYSTTSKLYSSETKHASYHPGSKNTSEETLLPSSSARPKNTSLPRLPSTRSIAKDPKQKLESKEAKLATVDPEKLISAHRESGHSVSIPETCPEFGSGLELLMLIMSAPGNAEARKAIRLTWGSYGGRKDVNVAFFLGNTTESKIEKDLLEEQELYGDVIRGNFLDSYSNLTLKVISALEWIDDYCPGVKFVLKTDDDMFINVPRLLAFIDEHSEERNVIFGHVAKGWKPRRDKKDKYYLPQDQFSAKVLPNFATGPAYLLSGDVVPRLYNASLQQPFVRLEDVFVTGIVAGKLGVKLSPSNEFANIKVKFKPCYIQKTISIHEVKYSEQFDLWKMLLDGKTKCK